MALPTYQASPDRQKPPVRRRQPKLGDFMFIVPTFTSRQPEQYYLRNEMWNTCLVGWNILSAGSFEIISKFKPFSILPLNKLCFVSPCLTQRKFVDILQGQYCKQLSSRPIDVTEIMQDVTPEKYITACPSLSSGLAQTLLQVTHIL